MDLDSFNRLKLVVRYIVQESGDSRRFGVTKINKILWELDSENWRRYAASITGTIYRRKPHGPAAESLYRALDELKSEQVITEVTAPVFDYAERRLVSIATKSANMAAFNGNEMAVIDRAIAIHRNLSASESSKRSHQSLAWLMLEDDEVMPERFAELTWRPPEPADFAAAAEDPVTDEQRQRWRTEAIDTFSA